MEEITPSQVATADPGVPDAGTTDTSVTDAAASPQAEQNATPLDAGTTDASVTAASTEAATPETPEAAKSRRERQREARKAAPATPPPAPTPTPAEIIAEYRRQQDAEQKAQRDHQDRVERNATFIGERTVTVNGESMSEYEQVRREAARPVAPGTTYDDLEVHNAAVARYNELTERRQMLANEVDPIRQTATQAARSEALQWIGNQFERGVADAGIDVQAVLAAGAAASPDERMPAIVKALASQIEAKHAPKLAELEDDLAAANEELDSLRRRLGGTAGQVERGGVLANGADGALTYERYAGMSSDERAALRSTPAGRAQIDAMTQGRYGAA